MQTYAEVKAGNDFSMREVLRGLALDGLSMLVNNSALARPRIQFLYIHHIFSDEIPALRTLLANLSQHFEFISHSEAVDRILNDTIDKPYISISSDDGFKNNLQAAEVFKEFGISACFFVNPSVIGVQDYDLIKKHCAERLHFPPVEFLSWQDMEKLQDLGQEIGSHTMWHMRVSAESPESFKEDAADSLAILRKHCGEIKHFAWPYGLFSDFNEEARRSVFELGFTSCSSAERGCHIPTGRAQKADELCIRRDHIILDWKAKHIEYFLIKSAQTASISNNRFPYTL